MRRRSEVLELAVELPAEVVHETPAGAVDVDALRSQFASLCELQSWLDARGIELDISGDAETAWARGLALAHSAEHLKPLTPKQLAAARLERRREAEQQQIDDRRRAEAEARWQARQRENREADRRRGQHERYRGVC